MIKRTIVAVFAATSLVSVTTASAEIPDDVSEFVRASIAGGTYVGMIIGLVDGDETAVESYGVASKETGEAPDADTVFEIGSITKTFTARCRSFQS